DRGRARGPPAAQGREGPERPAPDRHRPRARLQAPRLMRALPGLRARVIAAFCAGSLLLSVLLAVASYSAAREYLLRQREASAVRQAGNDAAFVINAVDPRGEGTNAVLDSLRGTLESEPVLRLGDRWYGTALGSGRDALPDELLSKV